MTRTTDAMNPEETLARWRAEEAAVRARLQDGSRRGLTCPGLAGRSGL
jgi:hypothetical protein